MWWIEFEHWINLDFQTYVNREVRVVHSDEMKLRKLLEKVKCEWLNPIKFDNCSQANTVVSHNNL